MAPMLPLSERQREARKGKRMKSRSLWSLFPILGPWPVSLSAIAASYSSEVFPPFLKELYSSPKISMMQSIFYITAHHHCHVQTTVGGTLPPPSWSPNFFPYFIFPIIATCVSVVK